MLRPSRGSLRSTMTRLPIGPLCYEFSRHREPRLRVVSGQTLVVATEDALSGQIRTDADRRDKLKMPYSNPMTGPIWVEGADPGDARGVNTRPTAPTIGRCPPPTADPKQLCEWLGTD